jgi:hypothetical protein
VVSKDAEVREVAGRRYWRAAEGRVMVDAWRRSGQGLGAFARRHGVQRKRVAWWASRLQGEAANELSFHPVLLTGKPGEREGIELETSSGWRVRLPRGFEAEELRRVLTVLGETGRC